MSAPLAVGQRIKLNDKGFRQITLRSHQDFLDSQDLTVTTIFDINAGSGQESIWVVQVDKPSINKFLLSADMFSPA